MFYSKEKLNLTKDSILNSIVSGGCHFSGLNMKGSCSIKREGNSVVSLYDRAVSVLMDPDIVLRESITTEKGLAKNYSWKVSEDGIISVKYTGKVTNFKPQHLRVLVDTSNISDTVEDLFLSSEECGLNCQYHYNNVVYTIKDIGIRVKLIFNSDDFRFFVRGGVQESLSDIVYLLLGNICFSKGMPSLIIDTDVYETKSGNILHVCPKVRVALYEGNPIEVYENISLVLSESAHRLFMHSDSVVAIQPMHHFLSNDGKNVVSLDESYLDLQQTTVVISKNGESLWLGERVCEDLISCLSEEAKRLNMSKGYSVRITYVNGIELIPYDINVSLIF